MALDRRQWLALGGVGLAAAVAGSLFGAFGLRSQNGAAALLAETFADVQGRATRLKEWPSRVLLCNFWATWCEPCREEIPLLIAAWRQHAANGFQIAGIGIDNAGKLQRFAEQFAIPYPVLVAGAGGGDLLRALGDNAAALPFSVILDRERRITHRKLGAWKPPELEREIRTAFG